MSHEPTPSPPPPQAAPQQALPPGGAYARPVYPRQPKSPGLAALLSLLFPGVGQVYNGQMAKAIVFFFIFVSSIYATVTVDPMPFAFFIPFTCLFNIVDAYRSADLINMRYAGGAPVEEEAGLESPAWGVVLVILGLVLLMNNLGWLPIDSLRRMWPILLIAAGGFILWGSFRKTQEADAPDTADAESGSDI